MTIMLDRPAEMSVATRNVGEKEEVTTMTAATYNQTIRRGDSSRRVDPSRRVRPHGIDRAIMRLSLMTLLWARRHAERTAISREEHTRMRAETMALHRREHDAALLLARVR